MAYVKTSYDTIKIGGLRRAAAAASIAAYAARLPPASLRLTHFAA